MVTDCPVCLGSGKIARLVIDDVEYANMLKRGEDPKVTTCVICLGKGRTDDGLSPVKDASDGE